LIDDILDFSRIEAGALQLELLPFSLSRVLRNMASVLSVGVRGKTVEPLLDFPPDIPDILIGDALRVQQILLNLTSNAVKFTETGSIVVSIRLLSQQAASVTLRFAVSDTGIGIAADQLGQIFQVFTQADSSICRNYGGSGLGLAISNRLLGLMGCQLHVSSTPGQGSEFYFELTLPLGDAQPISAQPAHLHDLHVLIIDDHPLAREILIRTCVSFGWQATACSSGAEGLSELQRSAAEGRDYDLLLLDWRMPEMDGLDMLRCAQSTPGIGLPLVLPMASAFELEQLVAASDDLYLDGIVAKPVIPEVLFEAIQRAYTGQNIEIEPTVSMPDRRLAGMHLLVVEDNEINRGLIEKILRRSGAEVELAINGQAAVAAIALPGSHFDAVLMDLQMPIMDGYSATQAIRNDLGRHDLPIIALTAHALPEDYHKARQVGMDGLITKPISLDELFDILGHVRPSSAFSQTAVSRPCVRREMPASSDWDAATYQDLLLQFLTRHGNDSETARALSLQGDTHGAARLVHELGGVTSFLGIRELARLAAQTEKALLAGELTHLPRLFDSMAKAMGQLHAGCPGFAASTDA
jgi:CheY-like chemotaxis protein